MSAVAEKRLALIGAGRVSKSYLDVLPELPEVLLSAAVEPVEECARAALARGARIFSSVDEMLARSAIPDAALVCTPTPTHLEVTEPLLHAGVDCLIERPLAMLPPDARRIATTAERLGRTVVTAANLRVSEALLRARRLIEAGTIGRLTYLESTFASKLDARSLWNKGEVRSSDGGVWMHGGSDAIDVVETLAGPITRIQMTEQHFTQDLPVEDEAVVETEHRGGLLSRILLSWNRSITEPIARCVGTEAELVVGWAQTVLREGGREEVVGGGHEERASYLAMLNQFFARRAKSSHDEDHGAQSVDWLHAGYRSLRSGRWEIA